MKPLRSRLAEIAQSGGDTIDVIERDYILSYILAGIGSSDDRGELVFKGGTSLRKIHFPDYRFSEDLDFSYIGQGSSEDVVAQLESAIRTATQLVREIAEVDLRLERKQRAAPHPRGQQELTIRVRYPWQHRSSLAIKVEITRDEEVLLPTVRQELLHPYDERSPGSLTCYSLDEVVIEKLRTLLQAAKIMEERRRDWTTRRGRDYFDLWWILKRRKVHLRGEALRSILSRKAELRGVQFTTIDDFFSQRLIEASRKSWGPGLSTFVKDLPSFDSVIAELRPLIDELGIVPTTDEMAA